MINIKKIITQRRKRRKKKHLLCSIYKTSFISFHHDEKRVNCYREIKWRRFAGVSIFSEKRLKQNLLCILSKLHFLLRSFKFLITEIFFLWICCRLMSIFFQHIFLEEMFFCGRFFCRYSSFILCDKLLYVVNFL